MKRARKYNDMGLIITCLNDLDGIVHIDKYKDIYRKQQPSAKFITRKNKKDGSLITKIYLPINKNDD
jgi:hypothetical protein